MWSGQAAKTELIKWFFVFFLWCDLWCDLWFVMCFMICDVIFMMCFMNFMMWYMICFSSVAFITVLPPPTEIWLWYTLYPVSYVIFMCDFSCFMRVLRVFWWEKGICGYGFVFFLINFHILGGNTGENVTARQECDEKRYFYADLWAKMVSAREENQNLRIFRNFSLISYKRCFLWSDSHEEVYKVLLEGAGRVSEWEGWNCYDCVLQAIGEVSHHKNISYITKYIISS